MKSKILQAVGMTLLLGGAAFLPATPFSATPAQAATVRPAVGKPLQQAISLANSGKGAAAMAKVHEAESVGKLTGAGAGCHCADPQFRRGENRLRRQLARLQGEVRHRL